jgi:hypothetical protein
MKVSCQKKNERERIKKRMTDKGRNEEKKQMRETQEKKIRISYIEVKSLTVGKAEFFKCSI